MAVLPAQTANEGNTNLENLPGWQIDSGELVKTFQFKDFVAALDFVNQVGKAAEDAGHHPDIDIRYNKVRLALVTHDAGGITAKDYSLAAEAEKLAG
jgi:4a-hydroxytetrahydrobiopterin dehydratase